MVSAVLLLAASLAAPEEEAADIADVQALDLEAAERQRYFLIGPAKDVRPPKPGFGLVVVLPGGDGGESFLPFVKRVVKNSLDSSWIAAQLVAAKWTPEQQIVWPTARTKVAGQKFSTEEFIEAVVAQVKKRHPVDPKRVVVLAWSSSGPAAYAHSLQKKKSAHGYYIAMSVFKPETLPGLELAKGNSYLLDHSPDDKVCPFRMAQDAEAKLAKGGARVKLVTYEGGHGWRGDLYGRLRDGWKWLEASGAK